MTEINLAIDGAIKQLQKINPNKANGQDKVLARLLNKTAMGCEAISSFVLSVMPTWHTII